MPADSNLTVADLAAREAVRDVVGTYCYVIDHLHPDAPDRPRAIATFRELFVANPVLVNASGTHHGMDSILAAYDSGFEEPFRFIRHFVSNQVLKLLPEGRIQHDAYWMSIGEADGASVFRVGTYTDVLVQEAGTWKFEQKGNWTGLNTTLERGWGRQ